MYGYVCLFCVYVCMYALYVTLCMYVMFALSDCVLCMCVWRDRDVCYVRALCVYVKSVCMELLCLCVMCVLYVSM